MPTPADITGVGALQRPPPDIRWDVGHCEPPVFFRAMVDDRVEEMTAVAKRSLRPAPAPDTVGDLIAARAVSQRALHGRQGRAAPEIGRIAHGPQL